MRSRITCLTITLFISIGCAPTITDRSRSPSEEKPDVRFFSDTGQEVSLYLEQHMEGDNNVLVLTATTPGRSKSTHRFKGVMYTTNGRAIIIPGRNGRGQLALLPLYPGLGPGTGLCNDGWLLVGTQEGAVFVQDMGTWECYDSHGPTQEGYSESFRLDLQLGGRSEKDQPVFAFSYAYYEKGELRRGTGGEVVLEILKSGEGVTARLLPQCEYDAQACAELLPIDKGYVSPSRWAAEVLQNIIPEAIKEYRNRKKEAKATPKLREGLSKTISDAIDEFYRQDSDE